MRKFFKELIRNELVGAVIGPLAAAIALAIFIQLLYGVH